jgi:hypothetical protein
MGEEAVIDHLKKKSWYFLACTEQNRETSLARKVLCFFTNFFGHMSDVH